MFGRGKKEEKGFESAEREVDDEMSALKERAQQLIAQKEELARRKEAERIEAEKYRRVGEREGDYPDKVDIGGVDYIRADVKENPREVTEKFLRRVKMPKWYSPTKYVPVGWKGFNAPIIEEFTPQGNLLFLLDNEEGIRIFENVKPGIFRTKQFEGTDNERENFIVLKANKLRTLRFDGWDEGKGVVKEELWKAWIADINNFNAYPDDPLYSSEAVSEAIRRAIADRRAFDEGGKKSSWMNWLKWVAIAAVVGYVGYLVFYQYGLGETLGIIKPAVDTATQGAGAVVTNVPGGTVSG